MTIDLTATELAPEVAAWLTQRQRRLAIGYTTTTPSGQTLDWVPIGSQAATIATPPPEDLAQVTVVDPRKPSDPVRFEIGEPGPAGHVPILRPAISNLNDEMALRDRLSKPGGLRVNVNRVNRLPTDPDPAGYFHSISSQSVRAYGADAWLNVWDPRVDVPVSPGDDHSISQTWLQNYDKPQLQSLEAGLTVDRGLNGDVANHLFTFYTTNGYTAEGDDLGGYNRLEAGWIQYHPTIYPGIRINGSSMPGPLQLELGIKYQLYEGNWWFAVNNREAGPWIWIGYYPASLFAGGLGHHVDWVGFGGEVYSALANPCTTRDQMGSGRHAVAGWQQAAFQRNLHTQSHVSGAITNFNGIANVDVAARRCPTDEYTIECFMNSGTTWGSYQFFGGPST
jgi:hypothetical protein